MKKIGEFSYPRATRNDKERKRLGKGKEVSGNILINQK